jgi:hypothetical protein
MQLDNDNKSLLSGLPGEDLLRQGLADFQSGRCTVPACLVQMARPRLTQAGLVQRNSSHFVSEPEFQLYRLLKQEPGMRDAYSRYNALLRELVSFEAALDHRVQKRERERLKT